MMKEQMASNNDSIGWPPLSCRPSIIHTSNSILDVVINRITSCLQLGYNMDFYSSLIISLVVLMNMISTIQVVDAFVLPKRVPTDGLTLPLAYGPHRDSESDDDKASAAVPVPQSYPKEEDFEQRMNNELDPMCPVEDEDCLAFSSLDNVFSSNTNEDPLCNPDDVDCQAFLGPGEANSDTNLAAELKLRSNSLEQVIIDNNWKTAYCPTTFVLVSTSDWVRRVHMETYPICVCGGARGSIYVVNLETKNVIGKLEGAHHAQVVDDQQKTSSGGGPSSNVAKQAMEKIYGKLDGGGVIQVQIHGDIIASSGREGGVNLWKIVQYNKNINKVTTNLPDIEEGTLVPLGSLHDLQKTIVTSLKFDSNGFLWTGCYDGTVRAYNVTDLSTALFPPREPLFQSDFTDSVLDINISEELGLGVAATADGGAALFNLKDGQFFAGIMLFDSYAARSILIMKHGDANDDNTGYSVLVGGSDGTIHRLPLNVNSKTGLVDQDNPFAVSDTTDTAIKPKHVGPVMTLVSPSAGKFVSGGQDGSLRIWECSQSEKDETVIDEKEKQTGQQLRTKCLYALTGYKMWLGSACTDNDGKMLISDGGESSIIIRDFSKKPGEKNGRA